MKTRSGRYYAVHYNEEDVCGVCLENFSIDEKNIKIIFPCNHAFHLNCVQKQVFLFVQNFQYDSHMRCPLCRSPYAPSCLHCVLDFAKQINMPQREYMIMQHRTMLMTMMMLTQTSET